MSLIGFINRLNVNSSKHIKLYLNLNSLLYDGIIAKIPEEILYKGYSVVGVNEHNTILLLYLSDSEVN